MDKWLEFQVLMSVFEGAAEICRVKNDPDEE